MIIIIHNSDSVMNMSVRVFSNNFKRKLIIVKDSVVAYLNAYSLKFSSRVTDFWVKDNIIW